MPANTPDPDEKNAVYGEINAWERHLANVVWIVSSFFIIVNLTAIKIILSDLGKSCIKTYFSCPPFLVRLFLALGIFAILWLIPAVAVTTALFISEQVVVLLENDKIPSKSLLNSALRMPWEALKTDTWKTVKDILKALKYPFGWIVIAFTGFFVSVWVWVFCFFMPAVLT